MKINNLTELINQLVNNYHLERSELEELRKLLNMLMEQTEERLKYNKNKQE